MKCKLVVSIWCNLLGDSLFYKLLILLDSCSGMASAYIIGMETREREKLIEIHEEALRFYLADPKLWAKEIQEKREMIERLNLIEGGNET